MRIRGVRLVRNRVNARLLLEARGVAVRPTAPYMKSLIQKLRCVAAIAVAAVVFGFSAERSEAASSATVVFTVDAGLVTHISITDPFGFYPSSGSTQENLVLFLLDLYPADMSEMTALPETLPSGMVSVAGSGVSYNTAVAITGGYFGAEADGDFALIFLLNQNLNLTTEDFVEISGGFAVTPSSNMTAPTAGSYFAALYSGGENSVPISNVVPVEVIVNAVPEPGSCLLGLIGVASLIVRRRR